MTELLFYVPMGILFALIAGVPGVALQYFMWRHQRKKEAASPLLSAWSALQQELVKMLHHPHPESGEMDTLLEKLETFTKTGLSAISQEDRSRLEVLLRQHINDEKQTKAERLRAEFLLLAMPRVLEEQKASQ